MPQLPNISLPYSQSMYALTNPLIEEDARNRMLLAQAQAAETASNEQFWANDPSRMMTRAQGRVAAQRPIDDYARERASLDALSKFKTDADIFFSENAADMREANAEDQANVYRARYGEPAQAKADSALMAAIVQALGRSDAAGITAQGRIATEGVRQLPNAITADSMATPFQAPGQPPPVRMPGPAQQGVQSVIPGQTAAPGAIGSMSAERVQAYIAQRARLGVSADQAVREIQQSLLGR